MPLDWSFMRWCEDCLAAVHTREADEPGMHPVWRRWIAAGWLPTERVKEELGLV